jgi:hypothetical protein
LGTFWWDYADLLSSKGISSSSEKPEEEGENKTHEDAINKWETKGEVASGKRDVPGKTTKPALAETRPKHQADEGDASAENEQRLAQFVHAMLSLIPNGQFLKAGTAPVKSPDTPFPL